MSDRPDDERPQPSPATPMEGVRILGAEEAQAVLEQQGKAPARPTPRPAPVEASVPPVTPERVDPTEELEVIEADDGVAVVDLDLDADLGDGGIAVEPDDSDAGERARRPVAFPEAGPSWSATRAPDGDDVEVIEIDKEPAEPFEFERTAAADTASPPTGEAPPLPHWTEPPTGSVPAVLTDGDDEADRDFDAWAALSVGQPRFRAEGSDWAEADFTEKELSDEHLKVGALANTAPPDEDAEFAAELEERQRRGPRARAARTMVAAPPAARRTAQPPVPAPETDADADAVFEPRSGRDLPTAIITAAGVVVAALLCFRGTVWTALLAAVIMGAATLELCNVLRSKGIRAAAPLALVGAITLPFAARSFGVAAYPVYFSLIVIFSMLWFLLEITPGRPVLGVASTLMVFGYIGGLGGFAGLLLASRDGVGLIVGVVACAVAYDVLGYFVGSQFGKSPIAPRVSPNKTFEGTVAGMLASVLVGWLLIGGVIGPGIAPWNPGRAAVLGLFVAVGAFLGDLCESMLKRDLGVKDFGTILPGHGGVLDRFDGLLFCLPIAYFLAVHFAIL